MKRCIVIADDDPTILKLVELRLGMARYNVVATSDAAQALAMVRAKEPVAVILDVRMPGGGSQPGGLAALAQIKADPKLNKLPVMMLTGERNTDNVMQAMTGGADDYMVKPFDPDTLLERVARLVKSSTMVWDYTPAPAATAERGEIVQHQVRAQILYRHMGVSVRHQDAGHACGPGRAEICDGVPDHHRRCALGHIFHHVMKDARIRLGVGLASRAIDGGEHAVQRQAGQQQIGQFLRLVGQDPQPRAPRLQRA